MYTYIQGWMRWVKEADDSCVRDGGGGIQLDQKVMRLVLITVALLKATVIQPCSPCSSGNSIK